MRRSVIRTLMLVAVNLQVSAHADEPSIDVTSIPLNTIWAWSMPGTRELRTSAKRGQPLPQEAKLVMEIRRELYDRPSDGTVRAGFAVRGNGLEALREAHSVLVSGQEPNDSFRSGDEISVVFFSFQSGVYVHLNEIERRGNVVQVRYSMVPHRTREATEHFALIPLGKLPAGTFRVELDQNPLKQSVADLYRLPTTRPELAQQIICGAFSFAVEK